MGLEDTLEEKTFEERNDIMNLGQSDELVWQVGSKGTAPSQTLSVLRRNLK